MRHLALVGLFVFLVAGCSNSDDPTVPVSVSGGGVKGPLANASVVAYLVDPAAADLAGTQLGTGATGANAQITTLTFETASETDLILIEIVADDDTVDITTGAAPIITQMRTIVTAAQLSAGKIFATPLTGMAIEMARLNGDSASAPYSGDANGSLSLDELRTALPAASAQLLASLGFGLGVDVDIFTSLPLLTGDTDTDAEQQAVIAYRQAVEAVSALLALTVQAAQAANPDSGLTATSALAALAADLADGTIDGMANAVALPEFADVSDVAAIINTDVTLLLIPGTGTLVSDIEGLLVSELGTTGVTVATTNIENGTLNVDLSPAKTVVDIDGDGIADINDAFPLDANESVDTDGDGIGNNADTDDDGDGVADTSDAFPLDSSESLDTDADGTGNNADADDDNDGVADASDALPLDPNSSVGNSKAIGTEGGTITSPDGKLTLTIPAGALSASTNIAIGTMAASAFDAAWGADAAIVDNVYVFAPDGLQFNQPAAVTYQLAPGAADGARVMISISNGVGAYLTEDVVNNPDRSVTSKISHFSELTIGNTLFTVTINEAIALPQPLVWHYNITEPPEAFTGNVVVEGYDIQAKTFSTQPEIIAGANMMDDVTHIEAGYLYVNGFGTEIGQGGIHGTCTDVSADGLTGKIRFNMLYSDTVLNMSAASLTGVLVGGRGKVVVEADATCRESAFASEPVIIDMGPDMDRLNKAGAGPYTEVDCDGDAYVIVSGDKTVYFNDTGTCTEVVNYTPPSTHLGAILIQDGGVERVLTHHLSGTTVGVPEDGFFARFFGDLFSPAATTDAVNGINPDGTPDYSIAYTVTAGVIYSYTPDAVETAIETEVLDTRSISLPTGIISLSLISPEIAIGVTNANPSEAYRINLTTGDMQLIGDVGSGALVVRCTSLPDAKYGCAASSYDTKELYPIVGDIDTLLIGAPLAGISTTDPHVRSNSGGNLVIENANDDQDKLQLTAIDPLTFGLVAQAELHVSDMLSIQGEFGLSLRFLDRPEESGGPALVTSFEDANGDGHVALIPVDGTETGFGETFVVWP